MTPQTRAQILDTVALVNPALPRGVALSCYDALMVALARTLSEGKSIGLPGVGILQVRKGAARWGFAPRTHERVQIPPKLRVKFQIDPTLKMPPV